MYGTALKPLITPASESTAPGQENAAPLNFSVVFSCKALNIRLNSTFICSQLSGV